MNNNKGFTLVELLAVIAILAILVIIALPNVMGMFNQAKEKSFTTELKNVYRVAQQEWVSESMFNTSEQVYTSCSSCTGKTLQLSGRTQLEYYIKLNKAGDIVEFYATDGTYQFSYKGQGLISTDITTVSQISDLQENEKIVISNNAVSGISNSTEPAANTIRICVYVGDQTCSYPAFSTFTKQYFTVPDNATINSLINNGTLSNSSYQYYGFIPSNQTNMTLRDYWNYFDYTVWNNPLKDETQGCYDGTIPPIC